MNTPIHDPVGIFHLFSFVREAQSLGQNRGLRVESIQHWSGGQFGDSWCCELATMVLDLAYQGDSPIPRGGSCQVIYQFAKLHHWIVSEPKVGNLYLFVNDQDHAHHVGMVTSIDPLIGIAGNTSEDGTSSNGDGVHEHPISARVFVDYTL